MHSYHGNLSAEAVHQHVLISVVHAPSPTAAAQLTVKWSALALVNFEGYSADSPLTMRPKACVKVN